VKTKAQGTLDTEIWAALNISGASAGFTIALSGSSVTSATVYAFEYYNVATSSATDVTANASSASSTTGDSGTTAATANANELWFGVIGATVNAAQTAPTNGFTLVDGTVNGTTVTLAILEKILGPTNAGTADAGTTLGGTGVYAGCMACFKVGTVGKNFDWAVYRD
jgi:hypothetical protein